MTYYIDLHMVVKTSEDKTADDVKAIIQSAMLYDPAISNVLIFDFECDSSPNKANHSQICENRIYD